MAPRLCCTVLTLMLKLKVWRSKNKMYYKDSNSYKVAGTTSAYVYDKSRQTILPRMYSNDENHIAAYRQWTDLKENDRPDFFNNLEFMFRFQLGEMYFRYFLFNFAGRESDVQYSTWLKPWDSLTGAVPEKSRNQYWMLPLILGLVGSCFSILQEQERFFCYRHILSCDGRLACCLSELSSN